MQTHIAKTLKDLDFEIATRETEIGSLKITCAALNELYGAVAPAAKEAKPKAEAKAKRKYKKRAAIVPQIVISAPAEASAKPSGEEEPLRVGSLQHRCLVECRKLPEPFTAAAVAVTLGLDEKSVGNNLYILCQKNLLEVTGREGNAKTYRCANG